MFRQVCVCVCVCVLDISWRSAKSQLSPSALKGHKKTQKNDSNITDK